MNKMMLFPLAILICLSVLSVFGSDSSITGQYNQSGGGDVQLGSGGSDVNSEFSLPSFDLGTLSGGLVILGVAIAVGTISSLTILGSGFSDLGQELIFMSSVYLGLWACFTAASSKLLYSIPEFGFIIWLVLTVCFVIGFAQVIEGGD